MRCLSSPSDTAFTGLKPSPGLCVTRGAQPGRTDRAAAAKARWATRGAKAFWQVTGCFMSGLVLQAHGPGGGARQPVEHRLPGRVDRRRLDQDTLRPARIELAQARIQVVRVARGIARRRDP